MKAHDLRQHLTLDRGLIHLNNAGVGPLTQGAQEAIYEMAMLQGRKGFGAVPQMVEAYEATRDVYGQLVGVPGTHVSMMQTCAAAISQVAFGISYEPGDEILLCDQEYPSNAYPWFEAARRYNVEARVISSEDNLDLLLEKLLVAMTPKTKVVALSWVQYQSGTCSDLQTIKKKCEEMDAWLVVDAIQGLGMIPFPHDKVMPDAICSATHKWTLGPLGHGFLILSQERREALTPIMHGAMTYGTPEDLVERGKALRTDNIRFEPGNPLIWGAIGGAASLKIIFNIGIENIHRRAMALSNQLMNGLLALGAEILGQPSQQRMSPIVTFKIPHADMGAIFAYLQQQKVLGAYRAGGIRLAPHAYNTEDEIAAVLDMIKNKVAG
jgi:cysteine desulfurase / selenocysteine lyase